MCFQISIQKHTPVKPSQSAPDTQKHITKVSANIKGAMKASGFFYISGLSIPASVINNVRAAQREFFALSIEQKNRIAFNKDNRGYLASGMAKLHGAEKHDQKEVFFWGTDLPENHPHLLEKIPLCANNQWPGELAQFRQAGLEYSHRISLNILGRNSGAFSHSGKISEATKISKAATE